MVQTQRTANLGDDGWPKEVPRPPSEADALTRENERLRAELELRRR